MKKITAVTIATSLGASPAVNAIDAIENNIENTTSYEQSKNTQDIKLNIKKERTTSFVELVEALTSLEGTVTATSLNVRKEPSAKATLIGKLNKNDKITIISQEDNGWYKIEFNGNVGYVSSSYVKVENNVVPDYTVDTTSTTGRIKGLVGNDTLNVRSLPNTKGTILFKLSNNTEVKIVGKLDNGWYRIEHNSKEGFVSGRYIEEIKNTTVETRKGIVVNIKANDVLNVRESSKASSKLLYTLKNNTEVDILDKLSNGWVLISYNGKKGYVNGSYIKDKITVNPGDNNQNNTQTTKYTVTSDINLRKTNSWSGDIVRVARKGEVLNVISIDADWAKINLSGTTVYAPSRYLTKTETESTTPEPQRPLTTKYIATKDVNIRETNEWSGNIIDTAKKGTVLNVISVDGDWAKVYHMEKELYVPAAYIIEEDKYQEEEETPENTPVVPDTPVIPDTPVTPDAPETPEAPETPSTPDSPTEDGKDETENGEDNPVETTKYVTTADVNMRTTGSWSGTVIKVIKSGTIVNVVSKGDNWTKIVDNNQYGYIPSQYVLLKDSNSNTNEEKNTKYTNYDFTISEYVKAQKNANPVSYTESKLLDYINPANGHKYEFLELDKFREINVNKLNQLLAQYNSGVLINQGQAIYDAAKKYSIDPLYFIAQSIHETGYGKSTLAKGVKITQIANEDKPIKDANGNITGYEMIPLESPVTVYNLYGIGAKDNLSTMPNRALILGTTRAYNEGWTSVEAAIHGAAKFVSTNYVNSTKYDQNTLYKIRYNPSKTYMWHQYATTPWYAREIAKLMEKMESSYESGVEFTYDKPRFKDKVVLEARGINREDSSIDRIGREDIVLAEPWNDIQ